MLQGGGAAGHVGALAHGAQEVPVLSSGPWPGR